MFRSARMLAPVDTTTPAGLSRRDLLRTSAGAAVGLAAFGSVGFAGLRPASAVTPAAAVTTGPKWLGHQPGRIYLGMATAGDPSPWVAQTGAIGMTREYYQWTSGAGETRDIQREHDAGRMPWVSFAAPTTTRGTWSAVAAGAYDAEIRVRAQRYAQLTKPIVATFCHEPQTKLSMGTPAEFAAAWSHVYDVMTAETGLRNVTAVPILGEWVFNPYNKGADPQEYLTPAVLDRAGFVGIDLYQNRSCQGYDVRLGRILQFLDDRGYSDKMVGLGETGACNTYSKMTAAQWWSASWAFAAAHTDRVGAVSYFNSLAFNNSGNNWLLDESADKMVAYRASAASATACRLV